MQKFLFHVTGLIKLTGLIYLLIAGTAAYGAGEKASPYLIQPGDTLSVSVWKEEDLSKDVIVRPDGALSFPLVGEISRCRPCAS